MKTLDITVIEESIQWINNKKPVWLCTVLRTYGSAPRPPGSLFAATSCGQYTGSLSGGCIEESFLKEIQKQRFLSKSQIIRYGEGESDFRPDIKLPCGGKIDVLIEHLEPTESVKVYLSKWLNALKGDSILQKTIQLGEVAQLNECDQVLAEKISQHSDTIYISIQSDIIIFIACTSAVAFYCIEFANALGFSIIVCEHRDEELRQLRKSKYRDKIKLIEEFPATYLEENNCTPQTAIISLTHDPRIDDLTMIAACETPAFYIGVMGSSQNSKNRRLRLQEYGDISEDALNRIHAPIGLPIRSKTPAEIALAIMADIIKTKNE